MTYPDRIKCKGCGTRVLPSKAPGGWCEWCWIDRVLAEDGEAEVLLP